MQAPAATSQRPSQSNIDKKSGSDMVIGQANTIINRILDAKEAEAERYKPISWLSKELRNQMDATPNSYVARMRDIRTLRFFLDNRLKSLSGPSPTNITLAQQVVYSVLAELATIQLPIGNKDFSAGANEALGIINRIRDELAGMVKQQEAQAAEAAWQKQQAAAWAQERSQQEAQDRLYRQAQQRAAAEATSVANVMATYTSKGKRRGSFGGSKKKTRKAKKTRKIRR